MKIKQILSLLLAVAMLATCFSGLTAFAEVGASFSLVEIDKAGKAPTRFRTPCTWAQQKHCV